MDNLEEVHHFVCPVYAIKKTEFLAPVRAVSEKYLNMAKARRKAQNPRTVMTPSFAHEESVAPFAQFVSQTAWNILNAQGFAMDHLVTYFTEMWTQEHNNQSSMDEHVHGHGTQISAFYFLNVPKSGCKVVIHDPRPGKVMGSLPEKDHSKITMGSNQVIFTPQEGTLMFLNSWLPHSFTRNVGKDSMRFVHMNLSVMQAQKGEEPKVEVI